MRAMKRAMTRRSNRGRARSRVGSLRLGSGCRTPCLPDVRSTQLLPALNPSIQHKELGEASNFEPAGPWTSLSWDDYRNLGPESAFSEITIYTLLRLGRRGGDSERRIFSLSEPEGRRT